MINFEYAKFLNLSLKGKVINKVRYIYEYAEWQRRMGITVRDNRCKK